MRVAILSSASSGGAGIAAYRIFEAIKQETKVSVDFLDTDVLGYVSPEVSPHKSATNHRFTNTHFTIDYANFYRPMIVELLSEYDVLNIHWASYLVSLSEIFQLARRGKHILFTLHDFYFITGGCHYPAGCTGFKTKCLGCPQVDQKLYSQKKVIEILKLKRKIFAHHNVHLSAPSQFIVDAAIDSGIVPIERAHVIRNAYSPLEDHKIGLNESCFSLLLVAESFNEKRKGLKLAVNAIIQAFNEIKYDCSEVKLHLVGDAKEEVTNCLEGIGLEYVLHGHVNDHSKLIDIFKKCNFLLTCSYEDNWPNILVEAGAYGCVPIVGPGHGCEEFCKVFKIGYVAEEYTETSFAKCLIKASGLKNESLYNVARTLAKSSRDFHCYNKISNKYKNVLKQIDCNINQNLKMDSIEALEISNNFLGAISRSLLSRIKQSGNEGVILKISRVTTPYNNDPNASYKNLVVLYENSQIDYFSYTTNKALVPVHKNGCWAKTIFCSDKKPSYGLGRTVIERY